MKTQSLSKHFLLGIGALALAMTLVAGVAAFVAFQHELAGRQVEFLSQYVRERGRNVDRRFSTLSAVQVAAGLELQRRMRTIPAARIDQLMDDYYPAKGDGTRRSRPQMFDGEPQESGGLIYGMGAFLGAADHMTLREKTALAAAFKVVSEFGQASHAQYDNFYFFGAPPANRLVMFGPDRPDRLLFYRQTARADLTITRKAMRLILPGNDPAHQTRCTNLERLLPENHGRRLATGCFTPVYLDGAYVGAFGSSLDLSTFFKDAVRNPLPGVANLVTTGGGELIAAPEFQAVGGSPTDAERRMDLPRLLKTIRESGHQDGVVNSSDGQKIVAYAKLDGPDWYLLMAYPRSAVMWSAMKSASWVLILGVLTAITETILLVLLTRRVVIKPIEQLAQASAVERGVAEPADIVRIEARRDEIGVLARALRAERDRADDVLNFLEQRVHERTAELERANAEKSRFLANMSHELRTPLNGVIAVAETLADRQSNAADRELAQLIMASGRLLEQVLGDVLDSSTIQAGEIVLSDERFSMASVIERVAALHRTAASAKGLSLLCEVSDEAGGLYRGDPVRLTQLLSNLLSNAVKFTEAGGVSLTATREADRVNLVVVDSGIGFDGAVTERLFERFQQADTSIRRRFGGAGLGLSISRALAELMGGKITARSAPGEGARFVVSLPLLRIDDQDEGVADEAGDGFSLEGCRILLAEDHPTNQKVVQLILEPFGAELVIVENGALALDRLAAEPFHIVLMDMQMPELDGLQATQALRVREAAAGQRPTPVIMLTANALDEHVRDSLNAGADLHLAKPVNPSTLLNAIADLVMAAQAAEADPDRAVGAA
jgi:signal transduction histidine kinase/ActR/RegA family two-component response regulator